MPQGGFGVVHQKCAECFGVILHMEYKPVWCNKPSQSKLNLGNFWFTSLVICQVLAVNIGLIRFCPAAWNEDWSGVHQGAGEGGSSMIWVETRCWDLQSRPIFIPNFARKWDPFVYQSHNCFSKIYLKFHIIFLNR